MNNSNLNLFNFDEFLQYAQVHFPALCAPRCSDSHKGTYGSLGVLGGAQGMVGAPLLAARAALKQGTGRVYIGFAQASLPISLDPLHAEIMLKTAEDLMELQHLTALVIGCGLGLDYYAKKLFSECLKRTSQLPLVIDADALSLLAQDFVLQELTTQESAAQNDLANHSIYQSQVIQDSSLSTSGTQVSASLTLTELMLRGQAVRVLTPHPTEAARLLNCDTQEIQADRLSALKAIVQAYQSWVVLKGHETLIGAPDGTIITNPSGNPGLASGGTGDVLAGMIGALLAQGIQPQQAIAGATWLHGAAADYLVSQGIGPIGLTASEVLIAARTLRNLLINT